MKEDKNEQLSFVSRRQKKLFFAQRLLVFSRRAEISFAYCVCVCVISDIIMPTREDEPIRWEEQWCN